MFVVVSDTHREAGHGLDGPALDAAREADVVVHAGDFTSEAAFSALRAEADRLLAVHGNSDDAALRTRLPARRSVEYGGLRVAVVHGHEHGRTALSLLGREEAADVVVFGHTHTPAVVDAGEVTLVNPGSPTRPRGSPATYAELDPDAGRGRLVDSDGETRREFALCREGA